MRRGFTWAVSSSSAYEVVDTVVSVMRVCRGETQGHTFCMERAVSEQPECREIASAGAPYVTMREDVELSAWLVTFVGSKFFCGAA